MLAGATAFTAMSVYYIPPLDSPFNEWQGQFARAVAANAASLGLTAEALAALAEGSAAWAQAFGAHLKARDAAQAACVAKDDSRADFTVTLQSVARQIQATSSAAESAEGAEASAETVDYGLSEADFRFLKVYTRSPALVEHPEALLGQTAVYMGRWVNRRSEPGPWSPNANATVVG